MKKAAFIFLFLAGMVFTSCKHDESTPEPANQPIVNADSLLYYSSLGPGSYNWYLQNDSVKRSSSASPHSKYFRVRFNAIAKNALASDGKLPAGSAFPAGAMVIKELYDSVGAPLKYLAVMYKDNTHPNQASGWLWLEAKGNGEQYISTNEKGAQCVSCHSSGRDYVRLFDLF
jgi:zona occludens toxin (predicted ATPase)